MTHARIDVGPYELEGGWKDWVSACWEGGGRVRGISCPLLPLTGWETNSFCEILRLNDGKRVLTVADFFCKLMLERRPCST